MLAQHKQSALGTLRLDKTSQHVKTYRLYLEGKRTDLTIDASPNVIQGPHADVHQTPKGILYGAVWSMESGAVTVSTTIAFVKDGAKFIQKPWYDPVGNFNEKILLVSTQDSGDQIEEVSGLLYSHGKLEDIGYTHEARFLPDGTVSGWYYADDAGTPYHGLFVYMGADVTKHYFEYKDGLRKDVKPNQ